MGRGCSCSSYGTAGEVRISVVVLHYFYYYTFGRTDKSLCRFFGAPACRVFPDHLIKVDLLYRIK